MWLQYFQQYAWQYIGIMAIGIALYFVVSWAKRVWDGKHDDDQDINF